MTEPRSRRPLTSLAILAYAVLGACWAAFAWWAVPPVIEAAYQGRSLAVLNRVFQRASRHPLEHYLGLWSDLAGAVLIAGALHLAFVLIVVRLGREKGPGEARANLVLILFGAAFLALTVLSGPRHDYVAYLQEWDVVLRGGDPWWILPERNAPLNAYGPLFNVLALLVWVNPLAPKLLFACGYILFVAWLLKNCATRGGRLGFSKAALAAWLLNPFPWVEIAYFGHCDILMALACVAAVHARRHGRDGLAGTSLALGVLFKYLPVVVVPFLGFEGRYRPRPRVWLAFVVLVALGLAASVAVWGPATFRPVTFAASRGSNLLSVFRFLRGAFSPLRFFTDTPNADRLALPCLAVAGLSVFLWCRWRRVEPALTAALAVLTTLLFYQVGFVQYQMVLFLLVSYWYGVRGRGADGRWLRVALACHFGWLALFDLFYAAIGGVIHPEDPWARVEDVVGLPTFLLGAFLLGVLLRVSARVADDS